jgi:hypothetical protein
MDPEKMVADLSKNSKIAYTLSRKIKVADKEYTELTLDFDSLTGADMETIAALPGTNSGDLNVNEFSKTYLMNVVARAAKITVNELRKFPIADATALTLKAQSFLMGAASNAIGN